MPRLHEKTWFHILQQYCFVYFDYIHVLPIPPINTTKKTGGTELISTFRSYIWVIFNCTGWYCSKKPLKQSTQEQDVWCPLVSLLLSLLLKSMEVRQKLLRLSPRVCGLPPLRASAPHVRAHSIFAPVFAALTGQSLPHASLAPSAPHAAAAIPRRPLPRGIHAVRTPASLPPPAASHPPFRPSRFPPIQLPISHPSRKGSSRSSAAATHGLRHRRPPPTPASERHRLPWRRRHHLLWTPRLLYSVGAAVTISWMSWHRRRVSCGLRRRRCLSSSAETAHLPVPPRQTATPAPSPSTVGCATLPYPHPTPAAVRRPSTQASAVHFVDGAGWPLRPRSSLLLGR
jgi:hypothetical protein